MNGKFAWVGGVTNPDTRDAEVEALRVENQRDRHTGLLKIAEIAKERDALRAQLDGLNELFLRMRDRVAGYVSAPPVARQFSDGAYAFEWAAASVRRAGKLEPPLAPPIPGNRPAVEGDN